MLTPNLDGFIPPSKTNLAGSKGPLEIDAPLGRSGQINIPLEHEKDSKAGKTGYSLFGDLAVAVAVGLRRHHGFDLGRHSNLNANCLWI